MTHKPKVDGGRWPGQWRVICDVCGFKFHSNDLRKRWDNLMVCEKDWELKHPQLNLRLRTHQSIPDYRRQEQPDRFVSIPYPANNPVIIESFTAPNDTLLTSHTPSLNGLATSPWTVEISAGGAPTIQNNSLSPVGPGNLQVVLPLTTSNPAGWRMPDNWYLEWSARVNDLSNLGFQIQLRIPTGQASVITFFTRLADGTQAIDVRAYDRPPSLLTQTESFSFSPLGLDPNVFHTFRLTKTGTVLQLSINGTTRITLDPLLYVPSLLGSIAILLNAGAGGLASTISDITFYSDDPLQPV